MSTFLKRVYLVPALPHILQKTELNAGYTQLHAAMQRVALDLQAQGVERIVYYSTNWIAVLGQMIQAKAHLAGVHTDENWYDYGNLDFSFTVDTSLAKCLGEVYSASGKPVKLIDYENFPVDTGTIVANTLANPQGLAVTMVANHVYSDYAASVTLASLSRKAIESYGKPTAVVLVSGLSQRFFTTPIDLREDRISDAGDDAENRKMLELLKQGLYHDAEGMVTAYAQRTKADMGFKALAWVRGLLGEAYQKPADVMAYAPVYGTGAAVVRFVVSL